MVVLAGEAGKTFFIFIFYYIFFYLLFLSEFAGGQRRLVSKLYSALAVGIYFFCLARGEFLFLIWQQKGNEFGDNFVVNENELLIIYGGASS